VTTGFLWLAMTTGLLSLLTPCVFPMIPVTIAFFSNPNRQHPSGMRRPLLFGLGIIATFTLLGLALAGIFGAAGLSRFAADPWVNLTLGALFLLFAANLLGFLPTLVPWRIANLGGRASRDADPGSSLGALLMGATFTLTSVTCTAPFIGTLLVLASRGTWLSPVVGMLVYSTAFAIPFVLLALAPRSVARLPRAGHWMVSLRVVIGLLEIAAAIKFVSNADMVLHWGLFTRTVVLIAWAALAAIAAVYLSRRFWRRDTRASDHFAQLVPAALAALIAVWLVSGITGRVLPAVEAFLPTSLASSTPSAAASSNQWLLNDYAGALATAQTTGKPVFIDFTGYTCTNCRWMEANIFSRPDVESELGNFVLARLYTDGDGELYEKQQSFQEQHFGTVALPLYAVVAPDGKIRTTFSGLTRDPSEFIAFLRRGRAATSGS
jgi:thiol:disulfide interchange protein